MAVSELLKGRERKWWGSYLSLSQLMPESLLFLLYHTSSKILMILTFAGGVFYLKHLYPLTDDIY